jgi:hypothetical protein
MLDNAGFVFGEINRKLCHHIVRQDCADDWFSEGVEFVWKHVSGVGGGEEEDQRTGHLNDILVHSPNIRFRLSQAWHGGTLDTGEPRGDEFLGDSERALAASADEITCVEFLEDDDAIDGL